jgi:hypothetical protein
MFHVLLIHCVTYTCLISTSELRDLTIVRIVRVYVRSEYYFVENKRLIHSIFRVSTYVDLRSSTRPNQSQKIFCHREESPHYF